MLIISVEKMKTLNGRERCDIRCLQWDEVITKCD